MSDQVSDKTRDQLREHARVEFVEEAGWSAASIEPLAQDASFRRYFRLTETGNNRNSQETCLLMDAPAPQENIDAYLDVTAIIADYGLRVPNIFAEDRETGFALIEDFGDQTFTRLLNAGTSETDLYTLAIDVLIKLHSSDAPLPVLPAYDMNKLLTEAGVFLDWFVPAVRGHAVTDIERAAYCEAWEEVLGSVAARRQTLVLRDFHVDNMMVIEQKFDVQHCGLLDYQDALIGAYAYDLMSLLEDARRDVSDALYAELFERYLDGTAGQVDTKQLRADIFVLGAQRHAKVAGIFARLSARDGKHHYLSHIPRVTRLLERSLSAEQLAPVKDVIEMLVPNYADATIDAPSNA